MMQMKIISDSLYKSGLKYLVKEMIMIFMVNEASTSVIKGICIIAREKRRGRQPYPVWHRNPRIHRRPVLLLLVPISPIVYQIRVRFLIMASTECKLLSSIFMRLAVNVCGDCFQ